MKVFCKNRTYWCFYIFLALTGCDTSKNPVSYDSPSEVDFITSDISNFWIAYDRAFDSQQGKSKGDIFQADYFDTGSAGLKDFIVLSIKSASSLASRVELYRAYYASVRENSLKVTGDDITQPLRQSFIELENLYEDAVFKDIYFLIGKMNSGGKTSNAGLLIGTEMFSRAADSPIEQLSDWLKQVTRPIDVIPAIVAHELIHVQQKYPQLNLLLEYAIMEGSADFIGEMISGLNINTHVYAYGDSLEQDLWQEFKPARLGQNRSNWLYNAAQSGDRPADLGYYVGYKICQAYYKKSADKKQAIRDILTIIDFEEFLNDSGYEQKFN